MPPSSLSVRGPRMWTNPQTGTKRFCVGTPNESEAFEIDVRSLDIITRKNIDDASIVSLTFNDGHLYAASNVVINCGLNKRASFGELDSHFELKTIFQSDNVNSLEVHDFEITSDGVVLLAGTTRDESSKSLTQSLRRAALGTTPTNTGRLRCARQSRERWRGSGRL
jgi:hypothetical protein